MTPSSAATRAHILLAEDEPNLRVLVTRILKRAGYAVVACENGNEALAVSAQHPCDFQLVLTDVVMPGVNGFDLAAEMQHRCPQTAVLMMTGYRPEEVSRPDAMRHIPLLSKPFTQADLLSAVENALRV